MRETVNLVLARHAPVFEAGRQGGTLDFQGTAEDATTAFLAMLQGLQILARAKGDAEAFLPAALCYIDTISAKAAIG